LDRKSFTTLVPSSLIAASVGAKTVNEFLAKSEIIYNFAFLRKLVRPIICHYDLPTKDRAPLFPELSQRWSIRLLLNRHDQ